MLRQTLAITVAAVVLFAVAPVQAGTLWATETILDTGLNPFGQDLTRIRTISNGFIDTETNDGAIVAANNVSDTFGVATIADVTYTHRLDWVVPPFAEITSASLHIYALGFDKDDVSVEVDTIFDLGNLSGLQTSFDLGGILATLQDGSLNVLLDNSNERNGWFGFNKVDTFKSTLKFHYTPVPTPTAALGGVTLLGILALRRYHRRSYGA